MHAQRHTLWLALGSLALGTLSGCVSTSNGSSRSHGGTGGTSSDGGGTDASTGAGAGAGTGGKGAGGKGSGDAGTGGAAADGGPGATDGGAPGGSASCLDLVQCLAGCDASACQDACAAASSKPALDAALALATCAQNAGCNDSTCMQSSCPTQLAACAQIAAADGGSLPVPEVPLVGARETWGGFSYVVPADMTEQVFTDGVVMTNAAKCTISLLPHRAASGDAGAQALAVLLDYVGPKYPSLFDENGGTSPLTMKRRGLTGDGFPWMMVRGYLSDTGGAQASWAQSLLVTLGSTVAPVVAIGDRACFEDAATGKQLDWLWTLLGLRFPGETPPAGPKLPEQLLGKWLVNTGSLYLGEIYAANGHYGTVSSVQTYSQVSSTDVLQTTTTFFGDGTFEAQEDHLTTRPRSGAVKTRLFTIVDEENTAVPTGWLPVLHRIELSATDGKPYEFTIARDTL